MRSESRERARCSLAADFLDMEVRWLFIARSYEFATQLESFLPYHKR
jgi:hypothetical protein